MNSKPLPLPVVACALAGVLSGLAVGTSWGERGVREGLRVVEEMTPRMPVDPLRGITRVEALARAEEARDLLEEGRPWAAWTTLEPFVRDPAEADAPVVLLAARAATAWTGWQEVRTLLRDRPWLADVADGEGLYLLGRGAEGGEEWARAADAYARYVRSAGAPRRAEAYARLGAVRMRTGDVKGAAIAYRRAADHGGPIADWFEALASEAGVAAGLPLSEKRPDFGSAAARIRAAQATAAFWSRAGDWRSAAAALAAEAKALGASDPGGTAALELARGRVLLKRDPAARTALRRAMGSAAAEPSLRAEAATLLGELDGLTADDELARAAAYEAAGKAGLAARSLRAALRHGVPDTPEQRLRLGELLWAAIDLAPARVALLDAAERLPDAERSAHAELLAARALVRRGQLDEGIAALKRVTERYPETGSAASAWFFLGDVSTTMELGIANYRRASQDLRSPHAAEALWRLGDRLRRSGQAGDAASVWGRLATELPRASIAARAGYEAGRVHEAAGRTDAATAAYHAAIVADPVSYYAIRAADRLGADPLAAPLSRPIAWGGDEPAAVQGALARLDALEAVGLDGPWTEELQTHERVLASRPAALLALAEGLRDRGHTIAAIRIGRRLQGRHADGSWDERLLRVVFPLPMPELLRREAERSEVDPHLLAGLIRQESSWYPRARSRVGATGLAQVMPSTGAWLAGSTGIRDFRPHMLNVPEVSLRMGARYLGDQLDRYRGRRDLALAAYNAGPGRADRWRREIGSRDVDAFREAIPFDETREYVKLVIRNAEVYRRLYGGAGGAGLVQDR